MFQDLIFFVLFVLKSCTYSFADYKYILKVKSNKNLHEKNIH